jgi:hypothetical protein
VDEPVVWLAGKVPDPDLTLNVGFACSRRQLQAGDDHAVRGLGGLPAILAEAQGQAGLANACLTDEDNLGVGVTCGTRLIDRCTWIWQVPNLQSLIL